MVSQAELERAIARYLARKSGQGATASEVQAVGAEAYPAEVEVAYEGTPTPIPPPGTGIDVRALPREAFRSDSALRAVGGHRQGARVPGTNEEPTVVAADSPQYMALVDSGVVELEEEEEG